MGNLLRLRCEDGRIKCMVVSQFTRFLTILETPLRWVGWKLCFFRCATHGMCDISFNILPLFTREHGFSFVRLDGSSNQKRRTEVIREFQNTAADSPTIMLLSLKAGGVGLNLTAASHVFIMDPVRFDYNSICFLSCRRSRSSQSPAFVLGLESRYRGAVHRPLSPSGTDEESYRHQG